MSGPADCSSPSIVSMVNAGPLGPVCGDGEVELDLPLPSSGSPLVNRVGVEGRLDNGPDILVLLPAFIE
eukprot:12919618-Prorocentrum_lima.AAC.1